MAFVPLGAVTRFAGNLLAAPPQPLQSPDYRRWKTRFHDVFLPHGGGTARDGGSRSIAESVDCDRRLEAVRQDASGS